MELLDSLKTWWLEYYPIVVGGLTAVGGVIAIALTVWSQIKPIIDKLNIIKDKVIDTEKENVTNLLQNSSIETTILDLKAKIANPTISDELKQGYITQLAIQETILAKLNAGIASVDEVTSKY